MEEQVAQAALAMVSPTTDSDTRRQASQFLEEWTLRADAWDVYSKWLASFRHGPDSDKVAMQLLCLQMLQSKIRKEIIRNQPEKWHPSISHIRTELWEYLSSLASLKDGYSNLVMPCCICNAAILVRCGLLSDFMSHVQQQQQTQEITLRLIACIPYEMEACQDLTNPQVTHQLQPHLELVLDLIRRGLNSETTISQSCTALKEWSNISHISLSQLNTPTCNQPHAVLPTLLQILSSNTSYQEEATLKMASQALTASIMVVSDQCTPTRETAASLMWNAIPHHGFIRNPLHLASQNEWHDACHALATLICTFVTEQIDDLVNKPASMGLQLLLELQAHPYTPVALIPLDCWLTIQEIPLEDRHEHWKQPLFRQVLPTLVKRIAYSHNFTNWQEELDLDSSEFMELRRMVTDVLVSGYFLLRSEFITLLTNQIRSATHWTQSEAALNALVQISREVCQYCTSRQQSNDKTATCQELIQLLDQLVSSAARKEQHPVLLGTIITFCGSYSPAWNSMDCPPAAILQLLQFLQSSFQTLPMESAKAARAIFIACLSKSMPNLEDIAASDNTKSHTHSIMPLVLKSVRECMEAVLATTEEDAMTMVAEGATRLVTKVKNVNMAHQALIQDLVRPVLHRAQPLLQTFPKSDSASTEEWCTPQVQLALETLVKLLSVIHTIVRFCDAPHIANVGEWLLREIVPFLETLQRQPAQAQKIILPKWIAIQQQLLRVPTHQSMILTLISNTIPLIVQALQTTQDPSTLKYISAAVEMFGGKSDEMDHSFKDLLSDITTIITTQLSKNNHPADATELLQSYFECLQRFILYCPRALCYSPQFSTILTLAVESIAALQGAKESTRAALLFLSQLFGWNLLRLSPQVHQVLQEAWHMVLQDMLVHHGSTLTQSCVVGLAGGPQMLWPAYSDCLFAIVQSVLNNTSKENTVNGSNNGSMEKLSENMMQHWLLTSMNSVLSPSSKETMNSDIRNQIVSILFGLARKGTKGRPKGKMLLTDFAKLSKGEMTPDALVSYAIS